MIHPPLRPLILALSMAQALSVQAASPVASNAPATRTDTYVVGAQSAGVRTLAIEAVVEAVREATLSSQVPGSVLNVKVKAGDRVKAGAVLLELDAAAAVQQVQGAQAQVIAAQTQETLALQELERQRALFKQQYVSQAALDRAQAQWDAARAQVNALKAGTQAAQAQKGYFTIRAPFDGVVSQVPANQGDMAMPGKPLVVVHDPQFLRIRGDLPQGLKADVEQAKTPLSFEVPGVIDVPQVGQRVELVPAVDPQTHTMTLRLTLDKGVSGLTPGMHARIWVPKLTPKDNPGQGNWIPAASVVRRGEMTGVYVVNAQGQTQLRQVRLGRESGAQVEVLSGLKAGETVFSHPDAALRRP